MASERGFTVSYKEELPLAIHDFANDTFKMALYTSAAELNPDDTTAYDSEDEAEVSDEGTGYTAGGIELVMSAPVAAEGGGGRTVVIDFDDPVWDPSTITAAVALIYNASKDDRAVLVIVFDAERTSDNGPLRVQVPPADWNTAALRIE